MRSIVTVLISLTLMVSYQLKAADTTAVYFGYKIKDLDDAARQKIDAMSKDLSHAGMHITILGFADYVGGPAYNLPLSQERANNVKKYLLSKGIKKGSIQVCIGKGEIEHPGETDRAGKAEDRKVLIITGHDMKDISQLNTNETLVLDNIYFLPGSHHVTEESKPELDKLYEIMKSHPSLMISIEGHICCETEEQIRFKNSALAEGGHFLDGFDFETKKAMLSSNRAKEIYDYLLAKGIDRGRLSFAGFGATKKIVVDEKTEADQNKNRRVEIRILRK